MWRRRFLYLAVVLTGTLGPALVEWASTPPPRERRLHVETFRYGTSPAILRANRGDRLQLSFSTRDTAHSFLLQSYRVEVKVSPAADSVEVIDPLHPAAPSGKVKELELIAGEPGLFGQLVSASRFRCHTYCGPMHGFEHGDLIVRPNYLLWSSLGALASIVLIGVLRVQEEPNRRPPAISPIVDVNRRWPWVGRVLGWRPLQFVGTLPVLAGFTLIVLAGLVGTKVGGRNFAVMMTWVVWMGLVGIVLAPLSTRLWCLVCPLPTLGEFLQRRALTGVRPAERSGRFGNRFFGLGQRWPRELRGPWLRMLVFVGLGTFSASLAGRPRWTAYLLLSLAGAALLCSIIWELRAFCRYLCPAASFISLYSAVGHLGIRNHDHETCHTCRDKACLKGNADGWACPYGLYLPGDQASSECGVCTECFKSCPHNNINLSWQRSPASTPYASYGDAWQAIVLMVLAMVYSLTIHSPWPAVRDLTNVIDKASWTQFSLYAGSVGGLAFGVLPLLFWIAVAWGRRFGVSVDRSESPALPSSGSLFKATVPALVPLGLSFWFAFLISIVMVNATFILYTLSDPFGWGWNLLGTAGMPWIQLWPSAIPWIQCGAVLFGVSLSLSQGCRRWCTAMGGAATKWHGFAPTAAIVCVLAGGMLVYFSYF